MLLLAQTGTVKIGEVVRYTITYTPSRDRILPSPERLYVRLRNTSNIALRAAFVHGPYTLCVAAYPSSYDPNQRFANPRRHGLPSFEPMVKAGGSWECDLLVPDDIRHSAATGFGGGMIHHDRNTIDNDVQQSASWVVEVSSQVIFSTSAAVGYELLVARDEKSLNLSSAVPVVGGHAKVPQPGKLSDHQQHNNHPPGARTQLHGVFSKAVHVKVEDTAALWNKPPLPEWRDAAAAEETACTPSSSSSTEHPPQGGAARKRQKKVHLVILTHGLHSNLGADMLYMKESVDAAARQAKLDARKRKETKRAEAERRRRRREVGAEESHKIEGNEGPDLPPSSADDKDGTNPEPEPESESDDDDDDDEEVIVRGYPGNATKTEKGIKYLGKRVARYVLSMTYPDQPYLPLGKGSVEGFKQGLGRYGHDFLLTHKKSTGSGSGSGSGTGAGTNTGAGTSTGTPAGTTDEHPAAAKDCSHRRPYRITSISFIGHSLGGLVQTYAIAYIQKHSPSFFTAIRPVNFIALASPFLGLSNENPLYVKFALDFGLVGRTGQDLGLTWRAPTIARSGWGAIVSNLGESAHKKVYGESQPESKPLLRILPTGPAHTALRQFRNRTVYSNVVNDGIVPLRTSCLLFLDWQGLGRVNKARRDAGLVETVVGFGWAELTGANSVSPRQRLQIPAAAADDDGQQDDSGSGANTPLDRGHQVPQPSSDALAEDARVSIGSFSAFAEPDRLSAANLSNGNGGGSDSANSTPLSGFFNLFRSSDPPKEQAMSEKQKRILQRSQTLKMEETTTTEVNGASIEARSNTMPTITTTTTPTITKTTTTATTTTTISTGKATSGHELENDPHGVVMVPPRTTFFESAGDLLNPKIPDAEYLLDPSKRPRTIFHDRVYHPADIPPPPVKKRVSTLSKMKMKSSTTSVTSSSSSLSQTLTQALTQTSSSAAATPVLTPVNSPPYNSGSDSRDPSDTAESAGPEKQQVIEPAAAAADGSSMRVEEKIARGYHRDLSWRKVLVKLEPDAHNNIIVRRMFPNSYGWPVMKHLADSHFSDSAVARVRDDDEVGPTERALDIGQPPTEHGAETLTVSSGQLRGAPGGAAEPTNAMEAREALDEVPDLPYKGLDDKAAQGERADSMSSWSERDWLDSENESDADFLNELARDEESRDRDKDKIQAKDGAGWNWAEKIVGKGATRGGTSRNQSPAVAGPTSAPGSAAVVDHDAAGVTHSGAGSAGTRKGSR